MTKHALAAFLTACGATLPGLVFTQARTTVTFFIASDCPISNAYAPEISRICKAYAAKGIACTLAYEDAKISSDAVTKHMAEYRLLGMGSTWDATRTLADAARVTMTPTAVIADGRGRIRYQGRIDDLYINIGRTRQQVTSHDVTDALDAILAGKPVAHPQTESLGCYIERTKQ
jgi:hypothetical protein